MPWSIKQIAHVLIIIKKGANKLHIQNIYLIECVFLFWFTYYHLKQQMIKYWKIHGREVENLVPLCKSVNIRDIYSEFTARKKGYPSISSSKHKCGVQKLFINFGLLEKTYGIKLVNY